MFSYQILQNLKFCWISSMKKLRTVKSFICLFKYLRHWTKQLYTIWFSQASFVHKIKPILLIELGSDHKIQIIYLFILSVWSCCQAYFEIKAIFSKHQLKGISRKFMNLISNANTPSHRLCLLKHFIFSFPFETYHTICSDKYPTVFKLRHSDSFTF